MRVFYRVPSPPGEPNGNVQRSLTINVAFLHNEVRPVAKWDSSQQPCIGTISPCGYLRANLSGYLPPETF
jgi:hypothetical protein